MHIKTYTKGAVISMQRYNVVDLFAGVGGLSYGFSKLSEFNILVANELQSQIAKAYTLNHPNVKMFNCDINELTEAVLLDALGGKSVDVLVGGPPCQSYSTIGNRKLDDRANLFLQYKRILQILQPRAFVFENVVGMLSMQDGKLFKQIQKEFEEIGYTLKQKVMDAADYGVPQHRKRVILIGFKVDNNFAYPEPTHGVGLNDHITLGETFGDLPTLRSGEKSDTYAKEPVTEFQRFIRGSANILTEHKAPKPGDHIIKIMEALKDGEGKESLPDEIRPPKGFGNAYAKLWWDRPSTTITRNFACPSSSRCIHPRDSRILTVREGARLQSIPDDYKLPETDTMKRLAIGNAVPPLLSMAIAKQILEALK